MKRNTVVIIVLLYIYYTNTRMSYSFKHML